MSTTNAATLLPGLAYPQAVALASEIDAATASAANLARAGFSPPVAVELARQCVAGTGDVERLRQCGFDGALCVAIKTAIDA